MVNNLFDSRQFNSTTRARQSAITVDTRLNENPCSRNRDLCHFVARRSSASSHSVENSAFIPRRYAGRRCHLQRDESFPKHAGGYGANGEGRQVIHHNVPVACQLKKLPGIQRMDQNRPELRPCPLTWRRSGPRTEPCSR